MSAESSVDIGELQAAAADVASWRRPTLIVGDISTLHVQGGWSPEKVSRATAAEILSRI